MPQLVYELQLTPRGPTDEISPNLYAVLVTDSVSQQPTPGRVVQIELRGAGSLQSGQQSTTSQEQTREDGKAYFSWWPPAGNIGESAAKTELLIQVDGDDALLEIVPLTPAREDALTESVSEHFDPQRETLERRAYELYEERGMEHGRDLDDWRQAESEQGGGKQP